MQEGELGGKARELQSGAVLVGLGLAPDLFYIDGESGMPPCELQDVGVKIDVNTRWMGTGDFEGDEGRGSL